MIAPKIQGKKFEFNKCRVCKKHDSRDNLAKRQDVIKSKFSLLDSTRQTCGAGEGQGELKRCWGV